MKLAEAIEQADEIPPCQVTDPEIFYPEKSDFISVRIARKMCGECQVRQLCLEYALIAKEPFGIWGGLTARERLALTSKKRQKVETPAISDRGLVSTFPEAST